MFFSSSDVRPDISRSALFDCFDPDSRSDSGMNLGKSVYNELITLVPSRAGADLGRLDTVA